MDHSFINMGFSGSGTFDIPVGEAMSEIDAALYIIDCNPNTKTELIYERAVALVKLLKERARHTSSGGRRLRLCQRTRGSEGI